MRRIKSSSIHPPETDPLTKPSSRTASIAPSGRGDEPHVLATVTKTTFLPSERHATVVFNTYKSALSIFFSAVVNEQLSLDINIACL